MKTPTHALIGYGCARLLGWRGRLRTAMIIGAVAPDLPVAIVWSWIATAVTLRDGRFHQPAIQIEMDRLYFAESWLSALHSLLHSPVSLAGLALLACAAFRRDGHLRPVCLAFLAGALTHCAADILSHVTDGPLILWPLDDTVRLRGPFSHWDPAYGGLFISALEGVAGAAFGFAWLFRRLRGRFGAARPHSSDLGVCPSNAYGHHRVFKSLDWDGVAWRCRMHREWRRTTSQAPENAALRVDQGDTGAASRALDDAQGIARAPAPDTRVSLADDGHKHYSDRLLAGTAALSRRVTVTR